MPSRAMAARPMRAREEFLGIDVVAGAIARLDERFEAQACPAAHAIDRLELRGDDGAFPCKLRTATGADQVLRGVGV